MKGAEPFAMTRYLGLEALVRPGWIRHRSNRSRPGRCRTPTGVLLAAGLLMGLLILDGYRCALGQPSETVVAKYRTEPNLLYRAEVGSTDYARERCRLDVYYPTDRKGFSTVVWFHGGGLTGGNRSIPGPLKDRGIAVVAAGYRLSPLAKSPAYIEDAAAAVAWTFRHIEKYGGSTNRIVVAGHSAGGYLTSMIGLDRRWLTTYNPIGQKAAYADELQATAHASGIKVLRDNVEATILRLELEAGRIEWVAFNPAAKLLTVGENQTTEPMVYHEDEHR